jgi:hypothetical protein
MPSGRSLGIENLLEKRRHSSRDTEQNTSISVNVKIDAAGAGPHEGSFQYPNELRDDP